MWRACFNSPKSCQMDLRPPLFSVCVMMICLLGAPCCDEINFPCPEIPIRNLTESPPRTCFQINDHFRYTCVEGYLRKAGTSSLTRCRRINSNPQWTLASVQCIPDLRRTTTRPPKTTRTKAFTSRQRTWSISASVSTETDSPDSTTTGPQVLSDHSQGFVRAKKATDGTTSTSATADLSNKLSSTTTTLISIASLMILCVSIGIGFFCCRRRSYSNRTQHPAEEQIPMNQAPSAQV